MLLRGSRAKTFSSPQSCGTRIIGPNALNRLSRRVSRDSGSSIWISTSFTLRMHFNRETSRTREIKMAMSLYDNGVTLLDTWRAMESLVDRGRCRAIGLSDIGLNELLPIYESARIKPAVVQVESHPYLPETELLEFCKDEGHCVVGVCSIGSRNEAGAARRSGRFPQSPCDLGRLRRRCCWHGRSSAARLCLQRPKLLLARGRTLTSQLSRKMRSMKSIAFRQGRDSMKL